MPNSDPIIPTPSDLRPSTTDIFVSKNSGVFIVAPASERAQEWLSRTVEVAEHNKLGNNLAVEAEKIDALVEAAKAAGLNVRR